MQQAMSDLNEIERGQLCQSAIESMYMASGGLDSFPGSLKRIIEERAWERREWVTTDGRPKGRTIELKSLRELITEKPIKGWGEDPKKIEALIKDDPECLALYREAMKEQGKRTDLLTSESERSKVSGTENKAYTCERLKREAPELFEEVKAGRMSANAAAIQAGIRKKATPEDVCLKAFAKVEDRVALVRKQIELLTDEERLQLKQN
jgi:hypothetical protein